jgi:hypothetical protein
VAKRAELPGVASSLLAHRRHACGWINAGETWSTGYEQRNAFDAIQREHNRRRDDALRQVQRFDVIRGLTPLFWSNINPYGTFFLDMARRLDLGLSIASDESAVLP